MKYTSPGFSVLLVLLLVTALSVAALSFMPTNSFLASLAIAREVKEYQYWATYGLMQYAIAQAHAGPDVLREPIILDVWPTAQSPYQGIIRATMAQDQIIIRVQLISGKIIHQELIHSLPISLQL